MYGPVIPGERVILRPPQLDDAARLVEWWSDPRVTCYIPRRHPLSLAAEQERIAKVAGDPNEIYWIVQNNGQAVGATGIHDIRWREGIGSTGTVIGQSELWGLGLGTEIMTLRNRYAFTALPFRKLKATYVEGNEASARALASTGYKTVGRLRSESFVDGRWRDVVLLEILREEWVATGQ
jgi:RimJ/RimL family protein N-acetyltransferase